MVSFASDREAKWQFYDYEERKPQNKQKKN